MNWQGCIFNYPLYLNTPSFQHFAYHMVPNIHQDVQWLNQFQIPQVKKEEAFQIYQRNHQNGQYPPVNRPTVTQNQVMRPQQVKKGEKLRKKRIQEKGQSIEKLDRKVKEIVCQCKMSGCIKQYCFCFKNGKGCSELCGCKNCVNKKDNAEMGNKSPKKKAVSCNCERSQCSKKYCECLAVGKRCGEHCNCKNCRN